MTEELKRRVPVLIVGDAVASTGFARVLHSVLDRLKHKYDVHHLGINYLGDPHFDGEFYSRVVSWP